MKIILSTCNEYMHLLRYYPHFWRKLWGKPGKIDVLGFDPPDFKLPEEFVFESLGRQEDFTLPSDPELWCWSDALLPYVRAMSEDYFLYLWDEQFPCTTANHRIIDRLERAVAEGRAQTAYLAFQECHNPGHGYFEDEVVQISQGAPYRTSIHVSIWRTERFLRYLRPGMTAWDFEQRNMGLSQFDGDTIIEPEPENHGMYVFDIYRKGIYNDREYDLRIRDMLDEEDRTVLTEMRSGLDDSRKRDSNTHSL